MAFLGINSKNGETLILTSIRTKLLATASFHALKSDHGGHQTVPLNKCANLRSQKRATITLMEGRRSLGMTGL
jgi:hypothetical protein